MDTPLSSLMQGHEGANIYGLAEVFLILPPPPFPSQEAHERYSSLDFLDTGWMFSCEIQTVAEF